MINLKGGMAYVGSRVTKIIGYKFDGEIRAIFQRKCDGKVRVVVENADGFLHILNPNTLKLVTSRTCPKCGIVTDWPEGSGACPTYHGYTGEGTCPLFVDGETRDEMRERFYRFHPQLADPSIPHITCPRCGMTSYHKRDREERYCGHCNLFHDQMHLDARQTTAATGGRRDDR